MTMTKLNKRVICILAAVLIAVALTAYVGIGLREPAYAAEQADNYWEVAPTIEPWYYGEYNPAINYIVGQAKYGQAIYRITSDANGNAVYNSNKNELESAPAGWYTLTANVEGTDEYEGIPNYQTKIFIAESRARWTLVPNIQSWVEGDEPQEPVGQVENNGGYDGLGVSFVYKKTSEPDSAATATKPTVAGTYEMIATANATRLNVLTARVSFQIYARETLKTNEWKVLPRIEDWVEGGTASVPVAEAKAQEGNIDFKYKDADGEWLNAKPTTAGEYYLVASAYALGYAKLENEYKFKIEPAKAETPAVEDNFWTVVPNIQGWVKGEVASAPIGRANAGSVSFKYKNVADNSVSAELPTETGEYVLIATAEADGYNTLTAEVSFRITNPVVLEEHDNSAWLIALVIVCVIAVLLCAGYIAIVIVLQKRGISLFGRKTVTTVVNETAPVRTEEQAGAPVNQVGNNDLK